MLAKLSMIAVTLLGLTACRSVMQASDIYIAQNATGANNGQDCSDAHAASFFNSPGNWGSGGSIGPGTTVHLCGTFTGAANTTLLSAHGNGSPGNPIEVLFEAGATLTSPAAATFINLNSASYFVIDGGKPCGWSNVNQATTPCNGTIQNTANGSASLGYANQIQTTAIAGGSGTNIEVRNLNISNLYVHDPSSNDTAPSIPTPSCFTDLGDTLSFHNNIAHDVNWCLNGGTHFSVYNNEIYHFDHAIGMGPNSNGQIATGIYFYNNYVHDTQNWDTASNSYHHDGVHLWAYCSDGSSICSGTYWTSVYIYNNVFSGGWGNDNTAFIFLEGNVHNAWVFNNYANASSGHLNTAVFYLAGGDGISAINNTCVGAGEAATSGNGGACISISGPSLTLENNILANQDELIGAGGDAFKTSIPSSVKAISNDTYMKPGNNAFIWCTLGTSSCNFTPSLSIWVSGSGETHAQSVAALSVNSNGTLQAGSPAIGAGANLYGTCNGQPNPGLGALCSDAKGTPRPASASGPCPGSTGCWDAGAFSSATSVTPPLAPSSLTAKVQ